MISESRKTQLKLLARKLVSRNNYYLDMISWHCFHIQYYPLGFLELDIHYKDVVIFKQLQIKVDRIFKKVMKQLEVV